MTTTTMNRRNHKSATKTNTQANQVTQPTLSSLDQAAYNAGKTVHTTVETGVKAAVVTVAAVATGLFSFGKGLIKGE